jgi:hypothetical protein
MNDEKLSFSPYLTFRTLDIDLHIHGQETRDKERKKLAYFKVISSGRTHARTYIVRQIVLSLLKQQIFWQVATYIGI